MNKNEEYYCLKIIGVAEQILAEGLTEDLKRELRANVESYNKENELKLCKQAQRAMYKRARVDGDQSAEPLLKQTNEWVRNGGLPKGGE